jgi:hypothetical protein
MLVINDESQDKKLLLVLKEIELPDGAYEGAKRRYDDLGAWFDRAECALKDYDPHIFVQGSFALGTAIRPVRGGQAYDLDLSCKLRDGIDRSTHSQRQFKHMVGRELEGYRAYRKIQDRLEAKHRCWRLKYQDDLHFHMDVVPGILADPSRRSELARLLEQRQVDRALAEAIAADAMWITDDRSPHFEYAHPDWLSSNPEGYVRWFLSRMEGTRRALVAEAQVDEVPLHRRKSALQRALQILKAHRDVMFEHASDHKPISVILTTLGSEAYVPEQSLTETMRTLLRAFDDFRRSDSEVVLNPVNPQENFADRWKTREGRKLELKENFHRWIVQVAADFQHILAQTDPREIVQRAQKGWKVRLDENTVTASLGAAVSGPSAPRRVSIQSAPRPWGAKF